MRERIATGGVTQKKLVDALRRLAAAMQRVQQYNTNEAWNELSDANFNAERLYLKYLIHHVNQ